MNKPIRIISVACMILFLALLAWSTYIQYWQADSLDSLSAHPDNIRVRDAEFSRDRGAIVVDGKAIAESRRSHDQYDFQRVYPRPRLYSHLTGWFSRDWGLGGIESSQNSTLSGSGSNLFLTRVVDLVDNQEAKGGSVQLTIDARAQRAAYDGLGRLGPHTRGAVVAIQPDTGRILAMASSPSYNPNRLATHDFGSVGKTKTRLAERTPSPLDNSAIESDLPPGSTFKLITAAAALDSGKFSPNSSVPGGSSLDLPLTTTTLHNENGVSCGGSQITLTQALEVSCNVAFGHVGLELGADRLRSYAEKFGFGQRYFHDLDDPLTRQAISRFPDHPDKPQTALSAIGQYDVAATPLQLAMVTAGIANDGTVMQPYLVQEQDSPDLDPLWRKTPEPLPHQPAISSQSARALRRMMVAVVDNGTGTTAQIPGVAVGGKTGTAQSAPNRPPYAWFTSMAPADHAKVAVAVLVQDAGVSRDTISGSGLAAPIAKGVMQAVINR